MKLRPYDPEVKVALAESYSSAAQCLDTTNEASRALAVFYLEQAVTLIEQLPSDLQVRVDISVKAARFRASLASLETKVR